MLSPCRRASRTSATSCGLLALAARPTAGRGERDLRLFLQRGENDRGVRARHARDAAQRFRDELIKAGCIARDDFEELRVAPSDPMALRHFADLDGLSDEALVVARVRDAHAHERTDVIAEKARFQARDVALDGAAFLELAHTIGHRGLREAHRVGDSHLRGACISLKQRQDLIIYRIEGAHLVILFGLRAHIEFYIASGLRCVNGRRARRAPCCRAHRTRGEAPGRPVVLRTLERCRWSAELYSRTRTTSPSLAVWSQAVSAVSVIRVARGAQRMAEEAGFEPASPCGPAVFKTAAFSRSATPPQE